MKKISHLFFILSLCLLPTSKVGAVMQSLNGQIGQNQSFVNDTNIIINSNSNLHTIGWNGILLPSRGGSGTSTAMSMGSIIFAGVSGFYDQNNSNLFWDNTNFYLGIGKSNPQVALDVVGNMNLSGNLFLEGGEIRTGFGDIDLVGTNGSEESSDGFSISMEAGSAYQAGNAQGGDILILSGKGSEFPGGPGGNISLQANTAGGGDNDGGNIFLIPGAKSGSGLPGRVKIFDPSGTGAIFINTSPLTAQRTITFPDVEGIISILSANQTFTGLNKFESNNNSTIYVGSDSKSGCIAIGDSDQDGMTYITANDGVLSSTSTKPSICN